MPIRYVLAIVLTVVLLTIGVAGVEYAADVRSEQQVASEIGTIEDAAVSLIENEAVPPPGHDGARRVVEIDLPANGYTTETVDRLVFERESGQSVTTVTYQFDGRAERTEIIEAPIETAGPERRPFDLSGHSGSQTIHLELVANTDRTPVIEASVE